MNIKRDFYMGLLVLVGIAVAVYTHYEAVGFVNKFISYIFSGVACGIGIWKFFEKEKEKE